LFESYVKEYPEDEETLFKYSLFLKESGTREKALSVFKRIYLHAEDLSEAAGAELNPSDISSKDLIRRASNLKKQYAFQQAEQDLRKALLKDDGRNRKRILKSLAHTLFKQKKYREAAVIYARVHDTYAQARSLYRAGDKKGFNATFKKLLDSNNRKAGLILIAVASDKRRKKNFDKALNMYNRVVEQFPAETKQAMWGIGWTHYTAGKYRKAAEVFANLYTGYRDPKYLYWQARSLEEQGDNASGLYKLLAQSENTYYSFLSRERNGQNINRSISLKENPLELRDEQLKQFERVIALQSLDMPQEAKIELTSLTKKYDSPEEYNYIISKYQELGEYHQALTLSSGIPYSEAIHRFWYPLAFWETVHRISTEYKLDPFVALSVMREESHFDIQAKSIAGALGLMQLMPQTAYRLERRLKLGITDETQIYNIQNNIHLGMYYLKSLFNDLKHLPYVLAAYNAGEQAVRKWVKRGRYKSIDEFIEDIPYPETRKYVKRVLTSYFQYQKFLPENTETYEHRSLFGNL
jgi:soluble lytic murein transglycosylase